MFELPSLVSALLAWLFVMLMFYLACHKIRLWAYLPPEYKWHRAIGLFCEAADLRIVAVITLLFSIALCLLEVGK